MLMKRGAHLLVGTGETTHVVPDTNVFRYLFKPTNYKIGLTRGVAHELQNSDHKIPQSAIDYVTALFNPEAINHFASRRDEELITRAALLHPKNSSRSGGDIGWVDMQQLSFLLRKARKGEYAVSISNDNDISNTVKGLRELEVEAATRIICLSPREYIANEHGIVFEDRHLPEVYGRLFDAEKLYLAA